MKKICLLAIGSIFSTVAFCQNATATQSTHLTKGKVAPQSATATPAIANVTPAVTTASGDGAVNPKTGVAPAKVVNVASLKAARKNKNVSMKATTPTKGSN